MPFGILQRYIFDQVFRSFAMALFALTCVIVLIMVMTEASRQGLEPSLIFWLALYVIPGTLPFTIPVAILFAVSVVYGRMASDNEVIAVKAAGCSVFTVLWPSIGLGAILSGILIVISSHAIPWCTHAAKLAVFKDAEDTFYMVLKRDREVNNPRWPFYIGVKDVRDRILLGATFKHRKGNTPNPNVYDVIVQAERAVLRFDMQNKKLYVRLIRATIKGPGGTTEVPREDFVYALPKEGLMAQDKRVQEMTASEMAREKVKVRTLLNNERRRQAVAAALWIASGRVNRVDWPGIRDAYTDFHRWERQAHELETETHMRLALASGPIFFVMLGAPVGILFAKRDFLSAFITCFVPIILIYYPLILAGVNMGKEGIIPAPVVWGGNTMLCGLAGLAIWRVTRH